MSGIGRRAFELLLKRADQEGKSFWKWCDEHNIERVTAYRWNKGVSEPSASYLADLANLGFDVQYILTGKPAHVLCKNCKYGTPATDFDEYADGVTLCSNSDMIGDRGTVPKWDDDFCSYGECEEEDEYPACPYSDDPKMKELAYSCPFFSYGVCLDDDGACNPSKNGRG